MTITYPPRFQDMSEMIQPIKFGVGSPLGSGNQYMNWIHEEDLAGMINFIIKNDSISGTFNAVSPTPETNRNFTRLIARIMKRPIWLPPVPAFVLKILFGEMSSVILTGNKVSCDKISDLGYSFKYDT